MPDSLPIVDTHLHLWDPDALNYPWLQDIPILNRPYLLDDYNLATEGLNIDKMVFLQCEVDFAQYRQEADWVTELALHDRRIQGIVPWAPLEKGEKASQEVAALAQNPLIKGVRRIIQFEDDPAFCLAPEFLEGVRLLADFDLHFEFCLKGDDQFSNAIRLVQQCPEVRFILDHIGKPFIKEGIQTPWRDLLKQFADLPNTWCKISGLVTEADFENWTAQDLQPYIDEVIRRFGWDRILFGGDWPVAVQASTYARWVETLRQTDANASSANQQKLFHDNAIAFYRL